MDEGTRQSSPLDLIRLRSQLRIFGLIIFIVATVMIAVGGIALLALDPSHEKWRAPRQSITLPIN